LSNATIAKKFAALRRIYRMLIGAGLGITENPFDTDRVPPPPKDAGRKRPTEMVDFDLVNQVIEGADPGTPKGLRDKAILCALFGGGLRRSEVAALRVGDVRRSRNGTTYLYLRSTKAKRDAEQALPPWAAKVIVALAEARLHDGAGPADYLFISYQGQGGKAAMNEAVSASGIYKLFKHYCALAGAGPYLTPHSARATAITRLLAAGIPHRQVQEFSRHSSIQMVEVYDKRRIGVDENPGIELSYEDDS
jgi:integrase